MEKIVFIIAVAICVSCNKGEDIVETRSLEKFSGFFVHNSFEIEIHPDTSFKVVLSGNSEIIKDVHFKMTADTLEVENNFSAKWLRPQDNPIKLDIYCDSLSKIVLNEACNLYSKSPLRADELGVIAIRRLNIVDLELDVHTIYYWNHFPCNGTIAFRGEAENLKIWNTALMEVDASKLNANYVLVDNDSGAECQVHANDILDYSITSSGNVYVSGNPEIINSGDLSGSGELILVE